MTPLSNSDFSSFRVRQLLAQAEKQPSSTEIEKDSPCSEPKLEEAGFTASLPLDPWTSAFLPNIRHHPISEKWMNGAISPPVIVSVAREGNRGPLLKG
jgi:hypothetical protein